MRAQRGTHELTLYNYRIPIRALLRDCGEEPKRLDARRLRRFVLKQSRSTSRWVAQRCTTALRMFLRFLIANGRCRAGLLGAIPVLAHWRLATLPRYLPAEDIERIIDSCKVSSPCGKRDRAILLLLARLGLKQEYRAHAIAGYRLEGRMDTRRRERSAADSSSAEQRGRTGDRQLFPGGSPAGFNRYALPALPCSVPWVPSSPRPFL